MNRYLNALFLFASCCSNVQAEIQTKNVEYQDGDVVLQGMMAWDDSISKAPGVLIVHQWMGRTEYEEGRAKQLAKMGFVAILFGT